MSVFRGRIKPEVPTVRRLLLDAADGYEVVLSEWEDGTIHGWLGGVNKKVHRVEVLVELLDTSRESYWLVDQVKINSLLGHLMPPDVRTYSAGDRPRLDSFPKFGLTLQQRYFRPALTVFKDYPNAESVICRREGDDLLVERVDDKPVESTADEPPLELPRPAIEK